MNRKPKPNLTAFFDLGIGRENMPIIGAILIVPDGSDPSIARRRISVAPRPIIVERSRWANLIRQWRNSPETPRDRRNYPTIDDILMMVIRRGLSAAEGSGADGAGIKGKGGEE